MIAPALFIYLFTVLKPQPRTRSGSARAGKVSRAGRQRRGGKKRS